MLTNRRRLAREAPLSRGTDATNVRADSRSRARPERIYLLTARHAQP